VDVSSPNVTVHGYYYAVQTRNYNTAWTYLAASRTDPGSKTAFISTAQSQDDLLGKVTAVWITSTELESESRVSISATIQRGALSTADATLAVSQHGSSWLIDSINSSSFTMAFSGPSADV
jgi:ABC-type amino acid transport substrate-binding protein